MRMYTRGDRPGCRRCQLRSFTSVGPVTVSTPAASAGATIAKTQRAAADRLQECSRGELTRRESSGDHSRGLERRVACRGRMRSHGQQELSVTPIGRVANGSVANRRRRTTGAAVNRPQLSLASRSSEVAQCVDRATRILRPRVGMPATMRSRRSRSGHRMDGDVRGSQEPARPPPGHPPR